MRDHFAIRADEPADHGPRSTGAAGRIVRGIGANFAGNGVTALIQIVSVPVFLSAWGVRAYGEWLVLSALPTYVALSDLSFSSVAGNSMVMLRAQGKRDEAVALGRQVWSIVTVMTAAAVAAAISIAFVFGGVFGSKAAIPVSEARVVLAALFIQVAIGNQYGVLDAWYRAGGHYPLGQGIHQVGRLIEFAALAGTAILGGRPGEAAVAFLIGSAVGFAISWLVLRVAVPWSSFRPERPRFAVFRSLLSPGLAFMAFPIGNALSIQGFTIVVGAVLGAPAVVVFSTTRTVTRVALQVMDSIKNAIWPELSRAVAAGRLIEARAILQRATQAALLLSMSFLVVAAVFGVQIIRWWTRDRVDPPSELLYLLLVVIVCEALWNTVSAVILATNQHQLIATVYLASTGAALMFAAGLTSQVGLLGAPLALLVIDVMMVLCVVPPALGIVQSSLRSFVWSLGDIRGAVRTGIAVLKAGT
jgi:O-antigen/teichoic acid export membrane protein